MTLGKRIAARRQSLGLTQEALADLLGTSKQVISRYERDEREPKAGYADRIAAALDTTIEALMHDEPAAPEAYGDRIKRMRRARGMSAEDLAEATGISPATIYRYENGSTEDLKLSTIERLAEALRTTPAHLAGWTEAGNHQDTTRPTDTTRTEQKEDKPMITLNDLLVFTNARRLRVIFAVSPRISATCEIDMANAAELDDIADRFGDIGIASVDTDSARQCLVVTLKGVSA